MNKLEIHNDKFIAENFKLLIEFNRVLIYKYPEKNIILTKYKADQIIDLSDSIEIIEFLKGEHKLLEKNYGITYAASGSSITEEARELWAKDEFIQNTTSCVAIIYNQLSHRLLLSMYLKFNKPKTPLRSFKKIADAIAYLKIKALKFLLC